MTNHFKKDKNANFKLGWAQKIPFSRKEFDIKVNDFYDNNDPNRFLCLENDINNLESKSLDSQKMESSKSLSLFTQPSGSNSSQY